MFLTISDLAHVNQQQWFNSLCTSEQRSRLRKTVTRALVTALWTQGWLLRTREQCIRAGFWALWKPWWSFSVCQPEGWEARGILMLLDKLMEPRGELRGGGSKVSWERAMGAGLLFLYTLLADKVSKLAFVCWTVSARLQIILELSSKPEVTAKSPSLTISSCSLHFICFPYLCPLLASLFFFYFNTHYEYLLV